MENRQQRLQDLRSQWATCTACNLCKARKSVVFGSGSLQAPLVVIGEGPGADEDEQGVPFVGPAGRLLDQAFATAEIVRRSVFITNTVACRPPRNRDPRLDEQEACMLRLLGILHILKPQAVLLVGKPASQFVLGKSVHITTQRGQTGYINFPYPPTPYVLTLHPAYILRSDSADTPALFQAFVNDIKKAWNIASRGTDVRPS